MESFYNLLKVLLCIYLGICCYILYQMIFYRQKRFILLKIIFFFGGMAILLIRVSNRYHIILFHIYLCFFLLGIFTGKKLFQENLKTNNKAFTLNMHPIKTKACSLLKKISIPPGYLWFKEKRKLLKYYKRHPHMKPKTIYDLF